MTDDPHEALVREATRIAFHTWDRFVHTPRIDGEPGLDRSLRGFNIVVRAVIALIAEQTKEANSEMLGHRLYGYPLGEQWTNMHSRSALWPKESGK